MNDDEMKSSAEELGKPLGEVVVISIAIANALRKQPGFDDAKFRAEIKALLARDDLSEIQQAAFSSLLGD